MPYCLEGRLFFSHKKGAIIRGGRLFQTFLTGNCPKNFCFIIPLKQEK